MSNQLRYYPPLIDLVDLSTLDNMPLEFLKDSLQSLFSKLYYKDLQKYMSIDRSAGFFSLKVLTNKRIEVTIPGTDVSLLINREAISANVSSFPISLRYDWSLLKIIPTTTTTANLLNSISNFLEFTTGALQLDDRSIILTAVNRYCDYTVSSSSFQQFIDKVHIAYPQCSILPAASASGSYDEYLLAEIQNKITNFPTISAGDSVLKVIYKTYLEVPTDSTASWKNIVDFFQLLIRKDIKQYILEFITPKIKTTLQLTGHLALPRKWLTPLYTANSIANPPSNYPATPSGTQPFDKVGTSTSVSPIEPRAHFQFATVDILVDSQTGANIQAEFAVTGCEPVMLGNTGLIIESFTQLKLDLRDDKNIPEIAADGRSTNFKGVYLKECSIRLPKQWQFHSSSLSVNAPSIKVQNLIVGSNGGVSGKLFVDGINQEVFIPFSVSNKNKFIDDIPNKLIKVTGDDTNNAIHLELHEDKDVYYRDIKNQYYKRDTSGGWSNLTPGKVENIPFLTSNYSATNFKEDDDHTEVEIIGNDPNNKIKFIIDNSQDIFYKDSAYPSAAGVWSKENSSANPSIALLPPSSIIDYKILGTDTHVTFDSFYLELHQNRVVSSSVIGSIYGGVFKYPIKIEVDFDNGFLIKAYSPKGLPLVDNNNIQITLDGLTFGKSDDIWKLGLAAAFTYKKEIPAIDKLIPKSFIVHDFLMKSDGTETIFDLEAKWANGAFIRGNNTTGLKGYFPVNKTNANGGFRLKGVQLNGSAQPDFNLQLLLVEAGIKIGNFEAGVDDIGVAGIVTPDELNGNLGPYKVTLKMVGPKGIYIKLKAGPVTGAGYLWLDDGVYKGGVSLELAGFSLTALAIITTKMPDGSKGFALAILIGVTFEKAIDIGFGFGLEGIGGLLGLHHSFDTIYLRDGIKTGSIDNILFPKIDPDPSKNNSGSIVALVKEFQRIMPLAKNHFVVGPMLRIGWPSTNSILKIDVGIFIEFTSEPALVQLALLGKLSASLPKKDIDAGKPAVVKLNIAFIGILDFDKKYLSFDASIYNSTILETIQLYGDLCVRIFWGERREMLACLGGFHPAFVPAANLSLPAQINRLGITLIDKELDAAKVSIKAGVYFAITSNTVQFGARVDLLVKVWKVEIVGVFGFDVIFQFNPFKFDSHVYASLALKMLGQELFAISLDFTLTGPGPWYAKGYGEFTVLYITRKAKFEHTWGPKPVTTIAPVDVLPILLDALQDVKNWSATKQQNALSSVTYREDLSTELLVDPNGDLTISQKVVPLNLSIERYGNAPTTATQKYTIDNLKFGSVLQQGNAKDVKDSFAPAQFIAMNDEQKLKAPSFQHMSSGISVSNNDVQCGAFLIRDMEYENIVLDRVPLAVRNKVNLDRAVVSSFIRGGAIAENAMYQAQTAILPKNAVGITNIPHKLLAKDDLILEPNGIYETEAQAMDAMRYDYATFQQIDLLITP
jgi:hypothetical protein